MHIEWPMSETEDGLFLAGTRVGAGHYRQVGRRGADVVLDADGILPASLDGRVACYVRVEHAWGQIAAPQKRSLSRIAKSL